MAHKHLHLSILYMYMYITYVMYMQCLANCNLQIVRKTGVNLIELDVSGCLELTDLTCSSIANHCQRLEMLGMMNLREVRGTELCRLFMDKRAKNFKCITLSGTKNVSGCLTTNVYCLHVPHYAMYMHMYMYMYMCFIYTHA